MNDPKDWYDRVRRSLGDLKIKDALIRRKAVIGPINIPASEEDAQAALDKLAEAIMPTAKEMIALEIVIRVMRPVPLSKGGRLADLPEKGGVELNPPGLTALWDSFRTKIKPYMFSIGRIELNDGTLIATGFLVGDGLLATNRHVLRDLTCGTEMLPPDRCRAAMKYEAADGDQPSDFLPIESVAAIHDTLDMVLLRVPGSARPALEIDPQAAGVGTRVVSIGYPGGDTERNPFFTQALFGDDLGVKRGCLGEVLSGSADPDLFHDCSTTGGSSGSPVISLETGKVVGIHKGGTFLARNEAVQGSRLENFVKTA